MKLLLLLLIFISYTSGYIDENALSTLQTLGNMISKFMYTINPLTTFRSLE